MGYQVYEDAAALELGFMRWAGYGVPAICDQPDCETEIDRGIGYRCGDATDDGCGLSFCSSHLYIGGGDPQMCERCCDGDTPFDPKPDTPRWEAWMLSDESWERWRSEHPIEVAAMRARATALVVEDEGSVHWRGTAVCVGCDWRGARRLYPKVAQRDADAHNSTNHTDGDDT